VKAELYLDCSGRRLPTRLIPRDSATAIFLHGLDQLSEAIGVAQVVAM
jgi:hypothetical protein